MNKCIFLARFAKDPDTRYTQDNSTAVMRGRVAVPRPIRREGEPSADFLNVVAFGKNAENIQRYFSQGSPILIESHVQTGSYTNREGQKVYTTDFIIDRWDFAGGKSEQKEPEPGEFVDVPDGEELPWT